jgi:amino acid adenylation domain-containing protein
LNEASCGQVENAELGNVEYSAREGGAGYWEGYLADVPALELPTDRPRPATLSSEMGVEACEVPPQIRGRVDGEIGLAVFAVLLHRYTAQEKFVIAARPGGGETLPVVADFSGRPTFRELVERLGAEVSAGRKAGAVPADLAHRLGIEPDASRHTIFQAAFSATPSSSLFSLTTSSISLWTSDQTSGAGLDLALEFAGESLRLHYNQDLFEPATAVRMLGHLQQLLAGAIEDGRRSCAALPMLTDAELREHLVERNQTARNFPERCLHELVEDTAATLPNAIAVAHGREQLSYAEFNARANQMAHALRKRGVDRNVRVGVCLPRSLDFAIALLGVLKAGGTVVPLDPKYPEERLRFMLEDVAAPLVLTERGWLQAKIPAGTQVIELSAERKMIAAQPRSNPSAGSSAVTPGVTSGAISNPSDIAYVIYTSGSTGRPRGVLLPHAGLANYTMGAVEMFGLQPGDRMLQFCSISFDAAIEEIFSAWASGATLVFLQDEVSLEPSELLGWAGQQRITVVDLPTAYWHEWVYALPNLKEKVPASLRLVIVGGEKSSAEAFATWHRLVGNQVRWINTYGPAEASVVATAYEPKLEPGDAPPARLPIGRPVANAKVYLLDADLNPVPTGVPGELHIAGAGVAAGYLNLPELTEQKFIRDIFSDGDSSGEAVSGNPPRMYKTGDLARYLPSGEIEFVGRRDNQVKIRGFRVEPGEIESVLTKHPGVNESAVILREDATGNKRLVGYVVRSAQGKVSESELRKHVKQSLPEYMVPAEFVFLDAMPLTPNGKINRRALAILKSAEAETTAEKISAKVKIDDPLQAQLIEIWEELLGRKPIGLEDNFFELGGHSLLAARLMHRIKQLTGKTLPLATLLQAQTVERLAAVLRGEEVSRHWSSLVAMQPEGSKPPFFMVHGVGGNVVGFYELARHMKPDYPFYGLQSQGLDGKRLPNASIENMAADYLAEIQAVQATGPYYLGGFSLGGLVAYEMARQLRARGEEVGLLVLFDTYATNPKPVGLGDLLRGQLQLTQLPDELRRKVRRTLLAWRLPEVLKKVMRANAQAGARYRLQPYDGKAVLLRAGDGWRVGEDPYAAWGRLVSELETIQIGGAHMDILREPQVGDLAESLKGCMDAAGAARMNEQELLVRNAG